MSLGKVKFTAQGGYYFERDCAKKELTLGAEYEVEMVNVEAWSSAYLINGKWYNTCLFAESQIVEDAKDAWRKSHYG